MSAIKDYCQIDLTALRNALRQDVVQAWELGSFDRVHNGPPRLPQRDFPYCWIRCPSVDQEFESVRRVEQTYAIEIGGRFGWPVDETVDLEEEKERLVNALFPYLHGASTYAEDFYSPLATHIEMEDMGDDPGEQAMEIKIVFMCKRLATHWPIPVATPTP